MSGSHRPDETVHTILVLADEVSVRMPVSEYLRGCGYRVIEAVNLAEAKVVLNAEVEVDLVFADTNLLGGSQETLTTWIRHHHQNTAVILTVGVANVAEKASQLCEQSGYLPKPHDMAALLTLIEELLKQANNLRIASDRRL